MPRKRERTREKEPAKIRSELNLVDLPFTILVLVLVAIGLVMVFSASYAQKIYDAKTEQYVTAGTYFFIRQCIFALLGTAVLFVMSKINYHALRKIGLLVFVVTLALLLAVFAFGTTKNGARRWIEIGPISIQPSEIAKFCIVLTYAIILSNFRQGEKLTKRVDGRIKINRVYIYLIVSLAFILGAVLLEKHLSATVIIAITAAVLLYLGGVPGRYIFIGAAIAAAFAGIYLLANPYAVERLTTFRDPWKDASDSGYQIVQSLYAIGSGGLFGLGFGNSRQKYLYLPEPHNDYIFSIICEELGFVGAAIIIILFILLIVRGFWIAAHAKDRFGALLTAGLMMQFALQVFLNICVVTNMIPSTGISLPFISYGGSALLLQMFEMGIVMNVSRSCDNRLLSEVVRKPKPAAE